MSPQKHDASEVFFGRQFRMEERSRGRWADMLADEAGLLELPAGDISAFPGVCKQVVEAAEREKLNTWPFYGVPRL